MQGRRGLTAPRRDQSESHITAQVAQLYAAAGGEVWWLSQRRASGQTPGLQDLQIVFRGRLMILHETKTPQALAGKHVGKGRHGMSDGQLLLHEMVAGIPGVRHVVGGWDEAWAALQDAGFMVTGLRQDSAAHSVVAD